MLLLLHRIRSHPSFYLDSTPRHVILSTHFGSGFLVLQQQFGQGDYWCGSFEFTCRDCHVWECPIGHCSRGFVGGFGGVAFSRWILLDCPSVCPDECLVISRGLESICISPNSLDSDLLYPLQSVGGLFGSFHGADRYFKGVYSDPESCSPIMEYHSHVRSSSLLD